MRKKLIPEKIRKLRDLAWMSQQDLADAAGLSLFTIQRIERGEGGVHGKTGRAIAEALGVTPDELTDAPKAQPPRERPVEPTAGAVEDLDALSSIVGRLNAWCLETIGSGGANSATLKRNLAAIDDVFEWAFRAYRTHEARGDETADLSEAIEALVRSSDVMEEMMLEAVRQEAVRQEASPEKVATIFDFAEHRRSRIWLEDPRRVEAS